MRWPDCPIVLRLHPAIVIVEFGGNDGLRGLPVEQTRSNLDQVLTALEKAHVKIVLAGITLPPDYGPDYIRSFEQMFRDLAARHHVAFVPMLYKNLVHVPGTIQDDGIHPTAKGSAIIADTLFRCSSHCCARVREPSMTRQEKKRLCDCHLAARVAGETSRAKSNSRDRSRLFVFCRSESAATATSYRLGSGQRLQARVQAALVAGNGVGVENALLHALVEGRNRGAVLLLGGLHVALGQSLAQRPQAGAHAAAVGAVHFSAGFGLAGALERRYVVCHGFASISKA